MTLNILFKWKPLSDDPSTQTFGKGLVQSTAPVGYNNYVQMTVAKYYIPSGRCIQAIDYSHRDAEGRVTHVPEMLFS